MPAEPEGFVASGGVCAPIAAGYGFDCPDPPAGDVAIFKRAISRGMIKAGEHEEDAESLAEAIAHGVLVEWLRATTSFLPISALPISAPRGAIRYITPAAPRPKTTGEKVKDFGPIRKALLARARARVLRLRIEEVTGVWKGSLKVADPDGCDDD